MTKTNPAVVDEILRFNRDRKPKGLRIKYQRMDAGAFPFFRGTDHLFARHWPELKPPDAGPAVWICGDLHLENFGAYRTEDGGVRYDINDFDEALIAPCSLDLVRCASSILLAAEQWKLLPLQASGMMLAYLEHYRTAVTEAVQTGVVGEVAPRTGSGPVWDLMDATAAGSQAKLLDRHTTLSKTGMRRIARSEAKHPELSPKRAAKVRDAVERYGRTTRTPEDYTVLDVAGRIAGIGSLGLRRYTVLIRGAGPSERNRLLDVKEARPAELLSCTEHAQPAVGGNEARRIVDAQRRLQARPCAGLDVLEMGGRWYRMREMVPDENRSSVDRLREQPDKLRSMVETAGRLTAWSQVRGSHLEQEDQAAGLAHWAAGPALESLMAAAVRFAERTRRDYEEFHRAYAAHRFDL